MGKTKKILFKNTMQYFFENCSLRVKCRIQTLEQERNCKIFYSDIFPNDEKMISRIVNCKIGKNNPYLLTDKVLNNYYDKNGIVPMLGFENEQEVLWGNADELQRSLPEVFRNMIYDLLSCNINFGVDVHRILCTYIPYAKYSYFWKVITDGKQEVPLLFWCGIKEDTVVENMEKEANRAIDLLYAKVEAEFSKAFIKFTKQTNSYSKIDEHFKKEFVCKEMISLLKKYIPSENALGLRVRNLIESDISKAEELFLQHNLQESNQITELTQKMINISSRYITELEEIQEQYLSFNNIMGGDF